MEFIYLFIRHKGLAKIEKSMMYRMKIASSGHILKTEKMPVQNDNNLICACSTQSESFFYQIFAVWFEV